MSYCFSSVVFYPSNFMPKLETLNICVFKEIICMISIECLQSHSASAVPLW